MTMTAEGRGRLEGGQAWDTQWEGPGVMGDFPGRVWGGGVCWTDCKTTWQEAQVPLSDSDLCPSLLARLISPLFQHTSDRDLVHSNWV